VRACFRLSASRSSGGASVDVPACSEEPAAGRVFLQEPLLGVSIAAGGGGGVSLADDPDDAGVTTSCAELGPALCGAEIAMRWSAGGDGASAGGLDTCRIPAAATRSGSGGVWAGWAMKTHLLEGVKHPQLLCRTKWSRARYYLMRFLHQPEPALEPRGRRRAKYRHMFCSSYLGSWLRC
jgi:hypothetical protein